MSFWSKVPKKPDGNVCIDITKRKPQPPPPPPDGEDGPPPEGDRQALDREPEGDRPGPGPDASPQFVVCTGDGAFNARRIAVFDIREGGGAVGKATFRRRGSRKVEFTFAKKAIKLDPYYWRVTTAYDGGSNTACTPTTEAYSCFDDTKHKKFNLR